LEATSHQRRHLRPHQLRPRQGGPAGLGWPWPYGNEVLQLHDGGDQLRRHVGQWSDGAAHLLLRRHDAEGNLLEKETRYALRGLVALIGIVARFVGQA